MVDFKLVLSDPKTGLSVQREVKEQSAQRLIGLKIGDMLKGDVMELAGYEFQITGGSDYCGFPMRKDVLGVGRKRILAVQGVAFKKKEKGMKQRKTVCGNTIHAKIAQINLKVVKAGTDKIFVRKEEAKEPAEKKETPKAEVKKPEAKPEAKKEAPEPKKEKAAAAEKPKAEPKK